MNDGNGGVDDNLQVTIKPISCGSRLKGLVIEELGSLEDSLLGGGRLEDGVSTSTTTTTIVRRSGPGGEVVGVLQPITTTTSSPSSADNIPSSLRRTSADGRDGRKVKVLIVLDLQTVRLKFGEAATAVVEDNSAAAAAHRRPRRGAQIAQRRLLKGDVHCGGGVDVVGGSAREDVTVKVA